MQPHGPVSLRPLEQLLVPTQATELSAAATRIQESARRERRPHLRIASTLHATLAALSADVATTALSTTTRMTVEPDLSRAVDGQVLLALLNPARLAICTTHSFLPLRWSLRRLVVGVVDPANIAIAEQHAGTWFGVKSFDFVVVPHWSFVNFLETCVWCLADPQMRLLDGLEHAPFERYAPLTVALSHEALALGATCLSRRLLCFFAALCHWPRDGELDPPSIGRLRLFLEVWSNVISTANPPLIPHLLPFALKAGTNGRWNHEPALHLRSLRDLALSMVADIVRHRQATSRMLQQMLLREQPARIIACGSSSSVLRGTLLRTAVLAPNLSLVFLSNPGAPASPSQFTHSASTFVSAALAALPGRARSCSVSAFLNNETGRGPSAAAHTVRGVDH